MTVSDGPPVRCSRAVDTSPPRHGPVVVGFDGSPAAEHALREAASLLGGQEALVVVAWEAGRAFELATLPTAGAGLSPTSLDIRGALEADRALYEAAEQLAQGGTALARELGLKAEGLTVAGVVTVADTLLRVTEEVDARAVVVGNPRRRAITELLVGSTARALIREAGRPVVVVRKPDEAGERS